MLFTTIICSFRHFYDPSAGLTRAKHFTCQFPMTGSMSESTWNTEISYAESANILRIWVSNPLRCFCCHFDSRTNWYWRQHHYLAVCESKLRVIASRDVHRPYSLTFLVVTNHLCQLPSPTRSELPMSAAAKLSIAQPWLFLKYYGVVRRLKWRHFPFRGRLLGRLLRCHAKTT